VKIPQICYTKKFKIGLVIGIGVAIGSAITGLVIAKIRKERLACVQCEDEYAAWDQDDQDQ